MCLHDRRKPREQLSYLVPPTSGIFIETFQPHLNRLIGSRTLIDLALSSRNLMSVLSFFNRASLTQQATEPSISNSHWTINGTFNKISLTHVYRYALSRTGCGHLIITITVKRRLFNAVPTLPLLFPCASPSRYSIQCGPERSYQVA